jgi:23S rRNA (adenine2503-C2)-methyltransferase
MSTNTNLYGLSLDALQDIATRLGLETYRATQLAEWLYRHEVSRISEMTNLPLGIRDALERGFEIRKLRPSGEQRSRDGSSKYLFEKPGTPLARFETVAIPDADRMTICVSTQSGCRMGCRFCHTATAGFGGQLGPDEILSQIRCIPESAQLTHLVFMGMGEPLDNPEAVLPCLKILNSRWGYNLGAGRVTVSTIGVLPALEHLLEQSRCRIALSVHSPFPDERKVLIPAEARYPVRDVIDLLKAHTTSDSRRVSLEYIVFDRFNDTPRHAAALAGLIRNTTFRVNLISYAPRTDAPWRAASRRSIEAFQKALLAQGVSVTIRKSRGADISAACGMLAGSTPLHATCPP